MSSYNDNKKRVLQCGPLLFSMDVDHDEVDTMETKHSYSEERGESTPKSPSSSIKRVFSSPAALTYLAAMDSEVTHELLEQEGFTKKQRIPKSASTSSMTQVADPIIRPRPSPENTRPLADPTLRLPPSPENIRPQDFLWAVLEFKGITPKSFPSFSLSEFFLPVTPAMTVGYDMELVTAVRQQNVAKLEQIANTRTSIQCCNRFGESIVHTACRTGSVPVLECLMKHGVSLRVRCDAGRTPLHDACWTANVNFDLIRLLVQHCPDFLYITDQHGFSPLAYFEKIRPEMWKLWNHFLLDHHDLLLPRTLEFQSTN